MKQFVQSVITPTRENLPILMLQGSVLHKSKIQKKIIIISGQICLCNSTLQVIQNTFLHYDALIMKDVKVFSQFRCIGAERK